MGFDILDKTFVSEVKTKDCQDPINLLTADDVKTCFLAFAMTFVPMYPTSAHTNKAAVSLGDDKDPLDFFTKTKRKDGDVEGKKSKKNHKDVEKEAQSYNSTTTGTFLYKEDPFCEIIRPFVPVDVVHALWERVLIQNNESCFKDQRKDKLKKVLMYVQDVLIKNLGLLEIQICRKVAGKIEILSLNSDEASRVSLK